MYAQITDGAIAATGTLKQLFPNTSFPAGVADSTFKTENGLQGIVNAERKDEKYYYVNQGDVTLVGGVATQGFTNTAMAIEDVDAKDSDGNQLYVQVLDPDFDNGEGRPAGKMVDTSEKMITRGLKYSFKNQIKEQANSALTQTDWMVIRLAEREVAIPDATVTYRAAVITEYGRLKTAITGAADIDALAVVMGAQNWPEQVQEQDMATFVNDLRLKEIATGDESGTWGASTNTNLELIGEALGYGTEAITTNADTHTSTVADGSTDPARAMYIKYTGTLDSACTITIAPNTMSRVQFIENATSGSQNIIISQGSGANITIATGKTKIVYLDGAGSGAAVFDALATLADFVRPADLVTLDTTVRTSAFTAVAGNTYMINTSSASFNITLPSSPAVGNQIGFMDVNSTFDVNSATLLRNGVKLFNATADGAIDIKGYAGTLVYTGTTYGWMPMSQEKKYG